MLRAEQIPDEVVERVMHCFHTRSSARAAIAAALSAWPEAYIGVSAGIDYFSLPLPQGAAAPLELRDVERARQRHAQIIGSDA
jgi:hypothetical protein